jgi:ribonuclease P protein component
MSLTFPRNARVRTRGDYTRAFDRARRTADPLMVLHWARDTASEPRLGLAVSRKVDRNAVGRNRIKRALREQFRLLRAQLPVGDYVIVARPTARNASNAVLREAFRRLLNRCGALPLETAGGTMPAPAAPAPTSSSLSASPSGDA